MGLFSTITNFLVPVPLWKQKGFTSAVAYADAQRLTFEKEHPTQNAVLKALNVSAVAGVTAVGVGAVSGLSAGAVVTKAITTAIKNPIKSAVGIVAVSAIAKSDKLQSAVTSSPNNLINFGQNIGKVIENPSKDSIIQTIIENPILSSAVGVIIGGAIAKVISPVISAVTNVQNTEAVKANTKVFQDTKQPETIIENTQPTPKATPKKSTSKKTTKKKKKVTTKKKSKKKKKVTTKKKSKKKTIKRRKIKK